MARAGAASTNGKAPKKSTNVFRSSDASASKSATDTAMLSERHRAVAQEPNIAKAIERAAGMREPGTPRVDPSMGPAPPPGRSTPISRDLPLSGPDRAAAIAAGLSESEAATEWRAFRDFNLSNAGRSFDWSAKWRMWLHRYKNFKPSSGNENSVHAAAKQFHDVLLARQSVEMFRPTMLPGSSP